MADALVPGAAGENAAPAAVEPIAGDETAALAQSRRWLAVLWGAMVLGIGIYLAVGSIRVGAGNWYGRRMTIREVWTQFLDYLAGQGMAPAIVVAVAVAAALTLLGGAAVLWLALFLRDAEPPVSPADEA